MVKCKHCGSSVKEKYRHQCNKCKNIRARDRIRWYQIEKKYGITKQQYQQLYDKQNGCCAICGRHSSEFKRALNIDHRHGGPKKGEITGLLCWPCNGRLIGRHHDSELFQKAAEYLRGGTTWYVPEKKKKKRKKKTALTH